tara:strand:+ start:536 stop:682 length:147 start_codon:yes stop_codon:yes gene_type:complete
MIPDCELPLQLLAFGWLGNNVLNEIAGLEIAVQLLTENTVPTSLASAS